MFPFLMKKPRRPFEEISLSQLKEVMSRTFNSARARAKRKALPFNITVSDLASHYIRQQGRCAITGRPLVLKNSVGTIDCDYITVDRKSPKKGYTRNNVQLVTLQANMAKGRWSQHTLPSLARDILRTVDHE